MLSLPVIAHVCLLATAYGIFHVGQAAPRAQAFLLARIGALVLVLAALWVGHSRMIEAGGIAMPWGVLAFALAASALVGLIGLEIMRMQEPIDVKDA